MNRIVSIKFILINKTNLFTMINLINYLINSYLLSYTYILFKLNDRQSTLNYFNFIKRINLV